ncbi:MAG: Fic family protein, partial [bacterium]|nr:Fic family protein [bacterium]
MQETEFAELLDGVNGILRGKKKDEWGMDGETVALEGMMVGVGYVPPRQEDKSELLAKVLTSAKEMSRDGKNLKDIALLISSSLNAIHPYLDANGRTSRLIYTLLTKDFNDETKAELQGALGRDGRDKLDIDPGLIQHEINDLIEQEIGVRDTEINTDKITNLFGSKRD